jgi:hypothetical protein
VRCEVPSIQRVTRDQDAQLLEAVGVRRARLRESLSWGRDRRRLASVDNLRRFTVSVVIAAVCCAGCVGWGFLQQVLADRQTTTVGTPTR